MSTDNAPTPDNHFLNMNRPENWIERFAPLIAKNGQVLDLACGGGRHSRLLLDLGFHVTAVDLKTETVSERLGNRENLTILAADLEDDSDVFADTGVLADQQFDGIVVVNYLHRPLFSGLLSALKPGGIFLYETFAQGNEKFSRPRNPDHLLQTGELITQVSDQLQIIAYEHGLMNACFGPGVKQRIAAINATGPCSLEDMP